MSALPNDIDGGQDCFDTQPRNAAVDPSPPEPNATPLPIPRSAQADALLLVLADALDDLERTRIANENRARALADAKGMGGTQAHDQITGLVDALRTLEHGAELALKRALRQHPLGPWVKATVGVGEKQGARLLAAIGDPADRRTVSQLWAYCGYHVLRSDHCCSETQTTAVGSDTSSSDLGHTTAETHATPAGVAPTRRKGQRANWNATAKMRAFLIAGSCVKQSASPYRPVYDAGRAKYADAVHVVECRRCGPAGRPAPAGSPLSAGHQHARALRLVAKAVLRDLWVEARRLRNEGARP